ncbi:MAG: hypothetical protein WHT06_07430 [Desulfobacterales bacterium]
MTRDTTRNTLCLSAADPAEQVAFATLLQGSLCANCRHPFDCSFLARTQVPILVCELHACGTPEAPRLQVIRTSRAPEASPEGEENAAGLCVNCENRIDCRLPKPAGGVWNCEEYR